MGLLFVLAPPCCHGFVGVDIVGRHEEVDDLRDEERSQSQ